MIGQIISIVLFIFTCVLWYLNGRSAGKRAMGDAVLKAIKMDNIRMMTTLQLSNAVLDEMIKEMRRGLPSCLFRHIKDEAAIRELTK